MVQDVTTRPAVQRRETDASGNYYDANGILTSPDGNNQFINGVWVDKRNGNRYINGIWVNSSGQSYDPNSQQWTSAPAATSGTGSFQVGVGEVDQARNETLANSRYIAEQNNKTQLAAANITTASAEHVRQMDAQLQLQLQQGTITSSQYMQARDLAQKEAEFARDLALRTLQEDHNYRIQQAQVGISQAAEQRQERELQAQLAANPKDFVAYEYYKRALGGGAASPQAWSSAQQFAGGGGGQAAGQSGAPIPTGTQLNGQPYSAAPPAYSDQTLKDIASAIYGESPKTSGPTLYNPGSAGTGAFGAHIPSPGDISRATSVNMSPAEHDILSSFLSAGSTGTGGASIDPTDWWTQQAKSMIPTLSGGVSNLSTYR